MSKVLTVPSDDAGDTNNSTTVSGGGTTEMKYVFSDQQDATAPQAGQVRFNAAYPYDAVTTVWIAKHTAGGSDASLVLGLAPIESQFIVQMQTDASRYVRCTVTAQPEDTGDEFLAFTVTPTAVGAATLSDKNALLVVFGSVGASGSLVVNASQVVLGREVGPGPPQELTLGPYLAITGSIVDVAGAGQTSFIVQSLAGARQGRRAPDGYLPLAQETAVLGTGYVTVETGTGLLGSTPTIPGSDVVGVVGEPGPTGPQGLVGPVGPPGPQGSQGTSGLQGATGAAGPQGSTGPAGTPGTPGTTGATGAAGAAGAIGPQGLTGAQGPTGATGPQGVKGDTGATGPQGDPALLVAHHATHETGGSDALTALSATVLTTGTVPDARLSANVALRNAPNSFTVGQRISTTTPRLQLVDPSQPSGQQVFEAVNLNGTLQLRSMSDDGVTQQAALSMLRNGDLYVGGLLSAPGGMDASQVTRGALPDARLSANVALKNIDNNFPATTLGAGTKISGTHTHLVMTDPGGPVDGKNWRWIAYQGDSRLRLEVMTDGFAAVAANPLMLGRDGSVTVGLNLGVGGTIAERGRSQPLGTWMTAAYDQSNFLSETGPWTVAGNNINLNVYALIGNVLTWSVNIANSWLSQAASHLILKIPGELWMTTTAFIGAVGLAVDANGHMIGAPCISGWDGQRIRISKQSGTWAAGAIGIGFTVVLPIS